MGLHFGWVDLVKPDVLHSLISELVVVSGSLDNLEVPNYDTCLNPVLADIKLAASSSAVLILDSKHLHRLTERDKLWQESQLGIQPFVWKHGTDFFFFLRW